MRLFATTILALIAAAGHTWDGYAYDQGNYVEIEEGNLTRLGREI